jgi:hypothetical protein
LSLSSCLKVSTRWRSVSRRTFRERVDNSTSQQFSQITFLPWNVSSKSSGNTDSLTARRWFRPAAARHEANSYYDGMLHPLAFQKTDSENSAKKDGHWSSKGLSVPYRSILICNPPLFRWIAYHRIFILYVLNKSKFEPVRKKQWFSIREKQAFSPSWTEIRGWLKTQSLQKRIDAVQIDLACSRLELF